LGIRWARRFDAQLTGLGVVDDRGFQEVVLAYSGSPYSFEMGSQLLAEARRKVEQLLEQFGARCAEANVSFNLLDDTGLPYEEILRESQRYDLVLFGHETHFRFGTVDRPDETLWNVLKRGPRPVVVAPAKLGEGASVVLAYNGSPQADRALQAFQSSGLDLNEEVCVFSAGDDREEAVRQAERAVEFLRLHAINAVPEAVGPADSIAQSILAQVRQRNARLLVMGAYGHSTVREFLLGSTTKAALQDSPVPVLLCH
jgi:nucleotide-binding universal stress UspA family protein